MSRGRDGKPSCEDGSSSNRTAQKHCILDSPWNRRIKLKFQDEVCSIDNHLNGLKWQLVLGLS